jgi:para-nitrobenzyl esterase
MTLSQALSVWCAVLVVSVALLGAEPPLRVHTQSGLVEGKTQETIRAFLGIPYAAPPVGELRWRPPQPVAKWDGVRPAKEFGPSPIQPFEKDPSFRAARGESEDCLTLNIWTPAANSTAKLPVMVWIYGGGLLKGSTSWPQTDGARLAERGVVVVSMNYRLGLFGFLVHPELIEESPQRTAGNYGLMDQLAALRWVRENIAAFGGDSDNVTIFGESAGALSVSALMASPLAKGFFHKAIGESGALPFHGGDTSSFSRKPLAGQAADHAELLGQATGVMTLAKLRAWPAQALLDAVLKAPAAKAIRFRAFVDGYFLPGTVAAIFAAGKQNDVPLLAGWNRDEWFVSSGPKPPPIEALQKTARDEFRDHADEFLRLYPAETREQATRSSAEFAGDRFVGYNTWAWLEAQAKTGRQAVYRYRFDRAPPGVFMDSKTAGAYHTAEIPYVFGTFDALPHFSWTDTDRALRDLVQTCWTNFARTGNPNGTTVPVWPAYSAKGDWPVMYLDAASAARPDDLRARYLFLAREWKP